jgi:hypothetical protein
MEEARTVNEKQLPEKSPNLFQTVDSRIFFWYNGIVTI